MTHDEFKRLIILYGGDERLLGHTWPQWLKVPGCLTVRDLMFYEWNNGQVYLYTCSPSGEWRKRKMPITREKVQEITAQITAIMLGGSNDL